MFSPRRGRLWPRSPGRRWRRGRPTGAELGSWSGEDRESGTGRCGLSRPRSARRRAGCLPHPTSGERPGTRLGHIPAGREVACSQSVGTGVCARMCRARGSLWESDGQDASPWEADRVPAARSAREQLRPGSRDPGRLLERGLLEEVTFGLRPVNAEKGNSQEGASPAEQVASEKVLENEKERVCSRN